MTATQTHIHFFQPSRSTRQVITSTVIYTPHTPYLSPPFQLHGAQYDPRQAGNTSSWNQIAQKARLPGIPPSFSVS